LLHFYLFVWSASAQKIATHKQIRISMTTYLPAVRLNNVGYRVKFVSIESDERYQLEATIVIYFVAPEPNTTYSIT